MRAVRVSSLSTAGLSVAYWRTSGGRSFVPRCASAVRRSDAVMRESRERWTESETEDITAAWPSTTCTRRAESLAETRAVRGASLAEHLLERVFRPAELLENSQHSRVRTGCRRPRRSRRRDRRRAPARRRRDRSRRDSRPARADLRRDIAPDLVGRGGHVAVQPVEVRLDLMERILQRGQAPLDADEFR